MYIGFDLKTDEVFNEYRAIGESIFTSNKNYIKEEINKFLLGDGSINGSEMQNNWFPQIKADIFISHSHADKNIAIGLAGWLKDKFDLNVFIDSCVWGYADDLLKIIDDKYCRNIDDTMYIYEKRNFSTSHVHMMLSTALTMMIDHTECIFFVNSPSSIVTSDVISYTKSPWIYYEIAMSQYIRRKVPNRKRVIIKKGIFEKALDIKYKLDLKHLNEINQINLKVWEDSYLQNKTKHPLDILYEKYKLIQ